MKYVVCVPDGCADEPVDELGGRTPLEVAPHADPRRAGGAGRGRAGRGDPRRHAAGQRRRATCRSSATTPPASTPVGRRSRPPPWASRLRADQVAFRCNLVTVGDDGTMVDFAGGHPSDRGCRRGHHAVDAELAVGGDGSSSTRRRSTATSWWRRPTWAEAECVPPHDLTEQPAVAADRSRRRPPAPSVMDASARSCSPTSVWRRTRSGCGARAPSRPDAVVRGRLRGRRRSGHRRRPGAGPRAC